MAEEKLTAVDWEARGRRLLDLLEPAALTCLYFYSVLSFVRGLVFGIVAATRCKLEANKRVGKICIILAIVNFVLMGFLVGAYVVLILFVIGRYANLVPPSSGGG